MTSHECKILSPVGSLDILDSAVFSGADYVYLSGTNYGARGYANNFNLDELKKAINFCHEYNVKVFVTVNISILEEELLDVIDYIFYLYSHGVDAIIIQDIGLGYIIHELIPDLSLHASTQMTIYDYSFVKWLNDNGFDNANISREVPISRIRNIISKLRDNDEDINIEVFGHGALCYCYSGRCLMSSFLGGRSGNRGLCAQPCRMRYVFEDSYHTPLKSSNYLLSTKDLCTYNEVSQIVNAGVNCIKIEGRMKSREYVSSITHAYRNVIDGKANDEDFLLINLAFNRGLTSGYIMENNPSQVVSRVRSGSQGYPIGIVTKKDKKKVTIKFIDKRYPTKIVNGDGLKFEFENKSNGMYVSKILSQSKNNVTILMEKNIPVEIDSMVYITYSKYLHDNTKAIINEKHVHKIPLYLTISVDNQKKMLVKCTCDELENPVIYTSKTKFEKANKKPLSEDTITKQFLKTGNTNYTIKNIYYENFEDNLFMPISTLNNIRRNLIEKIDNIIMNSYIPSQKKINEVKNNINSFKTNYFTENKIIIKEKQYNVYINTFEQIEKINNYDFIQSVYLDLSYHYNSMDDYCENIYHDLVKAHNIIDENKELVWILPSLLLDNNINQIIDVLNKLESENINIKIQTDSIGTANYIDGCYGTNLNIYNNYSINKLSDNPGFERLTLSNELSIDNLETFKYNSKTQLEYTIFGIVELMITEDNFEDIIYDNKTDYYYLVDKRGHEFKVVQDCNNHTHILDYRILNLTDELEKFNNTNIKYLNLDLRFFELSDFVRTLEYMKEKITNKESTLELIEYEEFFKGNFEKGIYKK